MDFADKVVMVTGGTSGIGLATARAFVKAGATVVIAGRHAIDDAVLRFVETDVRSESSVRALVDHTLASFGRLDIAFNAAGIGGDMSSLERTDQGVWDEVLAVNARGVWLSMRYQIPAMLASGGGSVVNMSSIYGTAGKAAHHAYVASKHAVVGMTRSVAIEYAKLGVRVNAVCAGVTATASMRQAQEVVPELVAGLVDEHPIGRMCSEVEVASAVMWLCSEGAGFVTGTALAVDGGFLAA